MSGSSVDSECGGGGSGSGPELEPQTSPAKRSRSDDSGSGDADKRNLPESDEDKEEGVAGASEDRSPIVREFIEGWDIMQVLGEGTFAEVKLLVNRETGEACAMKEVDLEFHPDAEGTVKKETTLQRMLKHPNIVQCYGSRIDQGKHFIFLEYCSGGELFDRIGKLGK